MITYGEWIIKAMEICRDTMTKETIDSIDKMDDEELGGMLMSGYYEDKIPPREMVRRIQAAVDK